MAPNNIVSYSRCWHASQSQASWACTLVLHELMSWQCTWDAPDSRNGYRTRTMILWFADFVWSDHGKHDWLLLRVRIFERFFSSDDPFQPYRQMIHTRLSLTNAFWLDLGQIWTTITRTRFLFLDFLLREHLVLCWSCQKTHCHWHCPVSLFNKDSHYTGLNNMAPAVVFVKSFTHAWPENPCPNCSMQLKSMMHQPAYAWSAFVLNWWTALHNRKRCMRADDCSVRKHEACWHARNPWLQKTIILLCC